MKKKKSTICYSKRRFYCKNCGSWIFKTFRRRSCIYCLRNPYHNGPDIMVAGQSREAKSYNNKADLWSLGAITYELLVGRVPFYASSYNLLKEEIYKGTYVFPKKLKLSVEAISLIIFILLTFIMWEISMMNI